MKHLDDFKEQRKLCKNLIRNAKSTFEKCLADKVKENPKAFYSYSRSKLKTKETVGPIAEGDLVVHDDVGVANIINDYFSSIFTIEKLPIPNPVQIFNGSSGDRLTDICFTKEDVHKLLKNLKPCKAPGPDKIYPRVLKELASEIAEPLYVIFKESLRQSVIPTDWRRANVTPIFKKGSRQSAANYRPVSLTSVVCKLLESIIRGGVTEHLNKYSLLKKGQHDFISIRF